MQEETSYQQKLIQLDGWMPLIIDTIKKELKSQHLKHDPQFAKHYFSTKNIQKLSLEELVEGYRRAVRDQATGEKVAGFISERWLLKHSDIYHYFEGELRKLASDFTQLEAIEDETARTILKRALADFGAVSTYLFSLLNAVVFSENIYNDLEKKAAEERVKSEGDSEFLEELRTVESLKKHYELEKSRMSNRYEKKIQGLEKKYIDDTSRLKKQVASLQKKMQELTAAV